jgi:hypothetical protein
MAADKTPPDIACNNFYKTFMANRFGDCFNMFSKHTQKAALEWTLKDIYARHPEAAKEAQLTTKEIQIMFKRSDPSLLKSFWKHFYQNSGTLEIFRYGYFSLQEKTGNAAIVGVKLVYPNGQQANIKLKMFKEGGQWRFGYLESGLPL